METQLGCIDALSKDKVLSSALEKPKNYKQNICANELLVEPKPRPFLFWWD